MNRVTTAMSEYISETIESAIENFEVTLKIDGMICNPEECTGEIDRTSGEINIDMKFGIKDIIKRHPEEYKEELHWPLFTEEERINLSQSMR